MAGNNIERRWTSCFLWSRLRQMDPILAGRRNIHDVYLINVS
jgi:hypothetical protein